MPTGIPKDPNGGYKGGYHVVTQDDLRSRIKEIEERIRQMDRREKALGDLKKWLANRKLDATDLFWMIRQMKPKRADRPVKSRKPLQKDGKLVAPKGDPEFRRRILEARKQRGWNSVTVGEKLGVSNTTVTNWEAGRYLPKEPLRVKILKLYGLPVSLGAEATKAMEASFGRSGNSGAV